MTELADMTRNAAGRIEGQVEDGLTGAMQSLRKASETALDLSQDAGVAISGAAKQGARVAGTIGGKSVSAVRHLTRQAADEVKAHPIASIAAALTAVGTIVGVIRAARGRKGRPAGRVRSAIASLKRM